MKGGRASDRPALENLPNGQLAGPCKNAQLKFKETSRAIL